MSENQGVDNPAAEDPDAVPDEADEGGAEPPGEEVDGPDEADDSVEDTAHGDGEDPAVQ